MYITTKKLYIKNYYHSILFFGGQTDIYEFETNKLLSTVMIFTHII